MPLSPPQFLLTLCRQATALLAFLLGSWLLLASPASLAQTAAPTASAALPAAVQQPLRRVLLIHGWPQGDAWPESVNRGFLQGLKAAGAKLDLYIENADMLHFERADYPALARYIERKYADRQPDLLLAGDAYALDFISRQRARLFPDKPLVLATTALLDEQQLKGLGDAYQVTDGQDYAGTLQLIRQLFPDTQTLVFIGSSQTAEGRKALQQAIAQAGEEFAEVRDYSALSLEGSLAKLQKLPGNSVVLLGVWLRNAAGQRVGLEELAGRVTGSTEVPVFGNFELMLEHGVVGGRMISGEGRGRALAALALRLLAGEQLEPVPRQQQAQQSTVLSYPALERFGLADSSRIPADAQLRDRPISLYESRPLLVAGALVAIVLLLVLVVLLLLAIRIRQRTTRRLAANEARYRRLFEENPSPMLVYEPTSLEVLAINQAFTQDFGFQTEDIIGQPISLLVLPEQRQAVEALVKRVLEQGHDPLKEIRWTTCTRDGEQREVEYSAENIAWGTRPARVVLFTDISERLQAEAALKASEQRLHQIIEGSPLPTLVLDAECRVTHWNRALERLSGRSAESMLGQPLAGRISYGDRPVLVEALLKGMSIEEMNRHSDLQVRPSAFLPEGIEADSYRPDLDRWLQSVAVPLRAADGRLLGAIQSIIDVTEVRRASAELQRLNSELEARVEQRTHELSQANDELQRAMQQLVQSEKLAALGGLVAGVAHELNTPIGNAMTVVTTLQDHLNSFNAEVEANQLRRSQVTAFIEACDDACQMLERNTRRAADLVASFKQVAVDQTSVRRRHFRLADALEETLRTVAPQFKHQPVEVQLQVSGELELDSYPGPLEQVITNLLGNAVVHARPAEGRLLIRISAEPLLLPVGPGVAISVRDDGVGMAEEIARKVFDPFFTTRLGQGGSGLGLYVVYNLVNGVLGGSIELQTAPGQGSCFIVRIPLHAQDYVAA